MISGSWVAVGCERGTYSDATFQGDASDCQQCTPGQYCDGVALTAPNGFCPPGYYCPTGTKGAQDYQCPRGIL